MNHPKRRLAPRRAALAVSLLVFGLAGCKHATRSAPPPPSDVVASPPDQLADGEILETSDQAFGLAVPDGMTVTKRLYANVVWVGTRPMKEVVDYIQRHVEATRQTAIDSTTFTDVKVKEPRSVWTGTLRIEVSRLGETTRVELWGEIPPPLPDNSGRTLPSWFQSGKPPMRAQRDEPR